MSIKGFTAPSLIDWDNEPCAVIFYGGCTFKCGYCHNAPLVLNYKNLQTLEVEDILHDIEGLGKYITGVCITGGEPLLHYAQVSRLCSELKRLGLKIKLDTNGYFPDTLNNLIYNIDYVAMDIKAPLTQEKYSLVTGTKVSMNDLYRIADSIELIQKFAKDYEFRTTVVPGLHTVEDIRQICKYGIRNAKKYVIQNFRVSGDLIDEKLKNVKSFSGAELKEFVEAAKPFVQTVKLRNN